MLFTPQSDLSETNVKAATWVPEGTGRQQYKVPPQQGAVIGKMAQMRQQRI